MSSFGQALYLGSFVNPSSKFSNPNAVGMRGVSDASSNGFPASPPYVAIMSAVRAASPNNVALAQTTAGAARLTLTSGVGNAPTAIRGVSCVYIGPNFDVSNLARSVTLTSAGNLSGVSFTITGLDYHNRVIVQTLAGPNANTVSTTKTFQVVYSVATSAAVGTAVSVGTGDVIGLPMRCPNRGLLSVRWDVGATEDAATFVAADNALTPTPTSGDIRGTVTPSSAPNGVRNLVLYISRPFMANQAADVYGVAWQATEAVLQ